MLSFFNNQVLSAFLVLTAGVAADCQYIAGMAYCEETTNIEFSGIGSSGSYNRVVSFNSDGTCSSTPQSYSGNMAPFDEELSVHFRGPISLENFKVFTKSQSTTNVRRALHHRHADPEPVMITEYAYDTIYVTVDGPDGGISTDAEVKTVGPPPEAQEDDSTRTTSSEILTTSIAAEIEAPSSTTPAAVPTTSTTSVVEGVPTTSTTTTTPIAPTTTTTSAAPTTSSSSSSSSFSSASSTNSDGTAWTEIASYNADSQANSGLVFLNNLGGSLSGVFDNVFGSSLSYMSSDGVGSAASAQCLSKTTVPSNHEFSIFTSSECANGDCGYYRPGTVAYHGFGGENKIFVFEFGMPTDTSSSYNQDMPAVWLLNAQIPRCLQYGAASCSCWSTGCGEIDLFEILSTGNQYLTTTIHGNQNGGAGSANYFLRPTSGTLKAAVIFDGTTITLVQIPEIPDSIDDALIASWKSQAGAATQISL